MTRVMVLVVTLVMLLTTACEKPDPFGGCNVHPGQCGRSK